MPAIQTDNLTKYYGPAKGIENLNLAVNEGEIFGFIGPNGAGKSTTIRTLLSLIYPTSGSANVLGYDIVKQARELKKHIGYLPADVHYYDDMTGWELLRYSASFYGIKADDYIRQLASRFELDLKRKFSDLSTGNKKKVAVVQSVLHRPRLLILDEPTGGLDPLMQSVFFDLVREVNAAGTTVFFSSHILSEVQRLCQRVAVVKDGQVIAVEEIHELLGRQLKHIIVRFAQQPAKTEFNLQGIENLNILDAIARFSYSGSMSSLLGWLQGKSVEDLVIEEPALEDVFMHFYNR
jgi:ABC-2 type transport system ATP-binding protein